MARAFCSKSVLAGFLFFADTLGLNLSIFLIYPRFCVSHGRIASDHGYFMTSFLFIDLFIAYLFSLIF
jgi:hypothetical protein